MKFIQKSLLTAFLLNLARAGIKDDTMACLTKCDTDRATALTGEDVSEDELAELNNNMASFEMCAFGEVLGDGTAAEGVEVNDADECQTFRTETPTDANVHDWWKARWYCFSDNDDKRSEGCDRDGQDQKLTGDINTDWHTCNERCEGETYSDPVVKEQYYCLVGCDDAFFESLPESLEALAGVFEFVILKFMCPVLQAAFGAQCCIDYFEMYHDQQMEDYLPARKSCMSTCYAPDEEAEEPMSQDSIDRWADYITCGSECVEDSGNADLEWLQMREILLGERDAGEACSVSGDNKDDDDSSSVAKSLSLALLGLLLVAFM